MALFPTLSLWLLISEICLGKGRPSRPSFLKAEEPAEDEENSRKEQLIEQEEEKEEEEVEKEEEVTFSKPSNFRFD